jgi:hypothetical protein
VSHEAVELLHRAEQESVLPWDCYQGNCDHDECREVEETICAECTRLATEFNDEAGCIRWPCPTIEALRR